MSIIKNIETEVLVKAICDSNMHQMESNTLTLEAITSTMTKTQVRAEARRNTFLVMNEIMFARIVALPSAMDMFDPNSRVAFVQMGHMGSFLGMDVRLDANVSEDCFAVVVLDFNEILIATSMRIIN